MKSFKEFKFLVEGKSLTLPALKTLIGKGKVYVLFGGTAGAGKSYWANKNLKNVIPILDQDEIAVEMAGSRQTSEVLKYSSKAMHKKFAKVKELLSKGESHADMGTMANEKAAINKLTKAKAAGFTTVLIFVSTPPEKALERNRARIASGDRGIMPEKEGKIFAQYDRAIAAFKTVKGKVDYYLEISS